MELESFNAMLDAQLFWTIKEKLINHIDFIYPINLQSTDFDIGNSWATADKSWIRQIEGAHAITA